MVPLLSADACERVDSAQRSLTVARERIAWLLGIVVLGADDECFHFGEPEVARARKAAAKLATCIEAALGELNALAKAYGVTLADPTGDALDAAAEE